jgi:hypothetical protein
MLPQPWFIEIPEVTLLSAYKAEEIFQIPTGYGSGAASFSRCRKRIMHGG